MPGDTNLSILIQRYLCNFLFKRYQQKSAAMSVDEFIKNQPHSIKMIEKEIYAIKHKLNEKIHTFNQKVDAINNDQETLLSFEFWLGDQLKQKPDLLEAFYAKAQSPENKAIYEHYQQQYQKLKVNSNIFFENFYLPHQLSLLNFEPKNKNILTQSILRKLIEEGYQSILLSHRTLEQRKAFYKEVHLEYVNNSLMIQEMNYELAKKVTNQYIGEALQLIEDDIQTQFEKA